jgi:hypothetical protein
MRFLQRSTHFSKTCCRSFVASFRRIVEQVVLTSELLFMVVKAQESHGARSGLDGGCSDGVSPISVSSSIATFQSRNADDPLRLLHHPKKGSFKTTVTPFSRSGWSDVRMHRLPREVLRKRDRYRTSTKFRLGVIG